MKLDIMKAYDQVEWHFLEHVMKAMGFVESWIKLVLMSITSVSYNVTHDGCMLETIFPRCGLHQGCPLSPYLFILAIEGLSNLIHREVHNGKLHGCKVARGTPIITHLLFTDNCLLLLQVAIEEVAIIKLILDLYSMEFGQLVNFYKSLVYFNKNVSSLARH